MAGQVHLSMGEKLAEIIGDMEAAAVPWRAAGYPIAGPEWDAREAVFSRLAEWNIEMKERG